ncbi:helix-turn-helix transcriptional regulator [Bradyrhizobium sp. UNPA324]|uniref:helix-turn-helix domain-containing protein n=1 Tax=Bradyrhizobium sp. UNPA324 TaxID=1141174 RepID=UPI00115257A0|nr:helix-turn-helix transcriptional regulator [Bradyrhizobium sp. UNPA324]
MGRRDPIHTRRLLARNLRRLRLRREWSQHDLAEEAGVRQALVSALEVTTANPTLESLDRISEALGVEVAALLAAPKARKRRKAGGAGPGSRRPRPNP